jgi:hypothetical protein
VGEEMKLISASALFFVIFLGVLFIYVAEDIPDFGDPYSAPNGYISLDISLDAAELEDNLNTKYYFIKKDGAKLDVYRYALIKRYVEEGHHETEVPNMVTYILADYRSYDTLGETTVIFTAGVGIILLLRRREKRPEASSKL